MGSLASLKSFMVALLHTVRATDSHKSGFLKYNGDNYFWDQVTTLISKNER